MKRIKAVFKGAETSKNIFANSQCLITISVGQESHEGEKFAAILDLINSSFASCIMLVDDSLQRHTMALNRKENADFFYKASIKEGDQWLKRNEKYINKFSILKHIFRWDKWLNHHNFLKHQWMLTTMLDNDTTYKEAFDTSIENFLKKYCERLAQPKKIDLERARKLSFDFVLEECTALSLWPELNCQFEVYPNRHNLAIEETRRRFVLQKHPDLLRAVTIGFRNASQIKPQHFESLMEETVTNT